MSDRDSYSIGWTWAGISGEMRSWELSLQSRVKRIDFGLSTLCGCRIRLHLFGWRPQLEIVGFDEGYFGQHLGAVVQFKA